MLVVHLQKEKKKEYRQKRDRSSRYIYQNALDKLCFQREMAYGDFKVLPRRTASDKVLHNKVFNIAKNPKYDGYHRGHASMVYNFLIKRPFCL